MTDPELFHKSVTAKLEGETAERVTLRLRDGRTSIDIGTACPPATASRGLGGGVDPVGVVTQAAGIDWSS